jgi:hypothetical protein
VKARLKLIATRTKQKLEKGKDTNVNWLQWPPIPNEFPSTSEKPGG